MCGIAGEVAVGQQLRGGDAEYLSMQHVLRRRGPDQSGIYSDGDAVLIHDRLAVIDIENGRQPMRFRDGEAEFVLVYNGELYNTDEIRGELLAEGYDFIGHSDTEVLLKAYVCFGPDCVKKFNGIFAFAIWEKHNKRLFLARDRIGVKPLFYSITADGILFSSEIKGILASPKVEAVADINAIAEIMLIGPGRTPGCGVFKGIKEIPPACCGYFYDGTLRTEPYWRLIQKEHTDNFSETAQNVRDLLRDAITRQLVSDVPIGTFLSGGLDSSIISSVAQRYLKEKGEPLHTFTVDYLDNQKYFQSSKFQPNSDSDYTGLMNEYLGAISHKVVIDTPALVKALYAAVDARDLPGMADVDSSLLIFCEEIKNHCTVALSGECADEIFGGYPWYRDKEIRETDGFPWAQSTGYRFGFLQPSIAEKIDPFEYVHAKYQATVDHTHSLPGQSGDEKRMREMMRLNLDWFMQTLLDRKDRMSMYSGLEVRVPFCDYRIAEYLYSVPWEYKDYRHYEKGLLRQAMQDYLPEEVLWRKKSPYPKTHNPSYLAAVSGQLKEVLADPYAPLLQIVKREALENLLLTNKQQPWYGQLMTTPQTIAYMLQFNYWLKKYQIKIEY